MLLLYTNNIDVKSLDNPYPVGIISLISLTNFDLITSCSLLFISQQHFSPFLLSDEL